MKSDDSKRKGNWRTLRRVGDGKLKATEYRKGNLNI